MDVVIFLDGSGYVSLDMFRAVKQFIKQLAKSVKLHPNLTKIIVVYVNDTAHVIRSYYKTYTKPKPKPLATFLHELEELHYQGMKAKPPSPLVLVNGLSLLLPEHAFRKNEKLHVIWFAKYDEGLLHGLAEVARNMVKKDRLKWYLTRWGTVSLSQLRLMMPAPMQVFNLAEETTAADGVKQFAQHFYDHMEGKYRV